MRDRDSKFGKGFDRTLRESGTEVMRLPHRAPTMNAFAERFIQTLQDECLDRFIAIGTRHLDHLNATFADHYNRERTHSAIGFRTPCGPEPPPTLEPYAAGQIRCRSRLGGLVRHYHRRAA